MNTVRISTSRITDSDNSAPLPPYQQPLIPGELVAALKKDIEGRRMRSGMERLSHCAHIFDLFDPLLENAAAFLAILARWCDVGYGNT